MRKEQLKIREELNYRIIRGRKEDHLKGVKMIRNGW